MIWRYDMVNDFRSWGRFVPRFRRRRVKTSFERVYAIRYARLRNLRMVACNFSGTSLPSEVI